MAPAKHVWNVPGLCLTYATHKPRDRVYARPCQNMTASAGHKLMAFASHTPSLCRAHLEHIGAWGVLNLEIVSFRS